MRKKHVLSLALALTLILSVFMPISASGTIHCFNSSELLPQENVNSFGTLVESHMDSNGTVRTTHKIDDQSELHQWLAAEGFSLDDISDINYITITDITLPQEPQEPGFKPFAVQDIRLTNISSRIFTDYNWTLRHSVFPAPGGRMDFSTTISTSISGSIGMSNSFLSTQLGTSITSSVTITESFTTPTVATGNFAHVIVHPRFQRWDYNIVRVVGNHTTNLGSGSTTMFIGVRFIHINRNHP